MLKLAFFISLTILTIHPTYAMSKKKTPSSTSQGYVVLIPGAASSGPDVYIKNVPLLFAKKYFGKYQQLLNESGVENFVCPETSDRDQRSVEEREDECVQQILEKEESRGSDCKPGSLRDVVLMGHSMGGLVARELAQDPRVSSCIKTVLGVSVPNQGAAIADFAIDGENGSHPDLYSDFMKFVGFTAQNLRYLEELRSDRSSVSISDQAKVFYGQDVPDNENVEYLSISSSYSKNPLDYLEPISIMRSITTFGTLNDGVVPEYSQIHGKYLGHLEVNHMESACLDLVKFTPGCNRAADFIIPVLKSQVIL